MIKAIGGLIGAVASLALAVLFIVPGIILFGVIALGIIAILAVFWVLIQILAAAL